MSDPFLGEIRIVGFNFAPQGWASCDGQLLQISQYSALFSLLGTTYGGDGRTTLGLPDLRGRFPMHAGTGSGLTSRTWGQKDGSEDATMPAHTHQIPISTEVGDQTSPLGKVPAVANDGESNYSEASDANNSTAASEAAPAGANMPPYLVLNFCIALTGVFPSQN